MTLPAPRFVGPRLPHRRGHRLRRLGPCHHERREASYPPQGGSGSPAEVWKWESGLIYTLDSHIITYLMHGDVDGMVFVGRCWKGSFIHLHTKQGQLPLPCDVFVGV